MQLLNVWLLWKSHLKAQASNHRYAPPPTPHPIKKLAIWNAFYFQKSIDGCQISFADIPWSQEVWEGVQHQCGVCVRWGQHVGADQGVPGGGGDYCGHARKYTWTLIDLLLLSLLAPRAFMLTFIDSICEIPKSQKGKARESLFIHE